LLKPEDLTPYFTHNEVTKRPPKWIKRGKSFQFSGRLTDNAGNPLGGRTINLFVAGSKEGTVTTGSDGTWSFKLSI